jgi:hypothetical protein
MDYDAPGHQSTQPDTKYTKYLSNIFIGKMI